MNYTVPPSLEDLETLAAEIFPTLPEEIVRHCEELTVVVEDFVDETTQSDLGLDDPFELIALYRSGKEIAPGIERKIANDDDVLVVFRRSFLDMWCETEEDIQSLLRNVMIEELGRCFEFSDEDIHEMTEHRYQGVL